MKSAWRAILKRYKLEMKGQQVGKEDFPGLIAKLWDTSFTPQQCKGDFRGAGLIPFSCEHVLQKLAPSAVTVHHNTENELSPEALHSVLLCTPSQSRLLLHGPFWYPCVLAALWPRQTYKMLSHHSSKGELLWLDQRGPGLRLTALRLLCRTTPV